MSAPQGTVYYSGIQGLMSANVTFTHGISPSRFQIRIPPQSSQIPINGNVVVRFGPMNVTFRQCRLVRPQNNVQADGIEIVTLTIEDRRWKWQNNGRISGRYNWRREGTTLVKSTKKTPQQLAALEEGHRSSSQQ